MSRHKLTHVLPGVLFGLMLVVISGLGISRLQSSQAAVLCAPDALLVNPCRPWVGAWASGYPQPGSGSANQLKYHEQRIGRPVDLVKDYKTPGRVMDSYDKAYYARSNTYLLVTWRPSTYWRDASGGNATVNRQIDAMATSIKALGTKKILLSLHHEPENDVSGGSVCGSTVRYKGHTGTPAEYRAMWHNVRARFNALGVSNVVWTQITTGYTGWSCMWKELYPGNAYVDWEMADLYATTERDTWDKSVSEWYEWMLTNSDPTYNFISKNWGLAEQSTHMQSKAKSVTFWTDARAALIANRYPKIRSYVVFDTNAGKPDNRIMYWCDPATANTPGIPDANGTCGNLQIDYNEQAAYKAYATDAHFTDAYYATHPLLAPDKQLPKATITLPTTTALINKPVTITVNASDNYGIHHVEYYVNGIKKGTDTTSPYTYSFTPTTSGNYAITAKVMDTSGNVGAAPAATLPVATVVPIPTPIPPPPTPPSQPRKGDINNDGKVDGGDYSMLVGHLGQSYPPADLNGDGIVSAADLAILMVNWTW